MNEPIPFQIGDRGTGAAQFFSRVQRYKSLLRRRWWVLLLTLGIAVGAQTYRASQTPLTYVSKAQLIIGNRALLTETTSAQVDEESFVGTTIALLKGNLITSRTVQRLRETHPDIAVCPVQVDVSLVPKTSIFILDARGTHPEYTRAYLDTLMEEFLKYREEIRGKSNDETVRSITAQLTKAQQDLNAERAQLEEFQKSNIVVFVEEQAKSVGLRLVNLLNELAQKQDELRFLESFTNGVPLVSTTARTERQGATAPMEFRDQEQVRRQLEVLIFERAQLAVTHKPKHPRMVALEGQIASQKTLLGVFEQQNAEELNKRRAQLQTHIETLNAVIAEEREKATEASSRLAQYDNIRERIKAAENLYARILAMHEQVKIGKEVPAETISVLEPSGAAYADNSGFTKNIIIGCFIGLVFGVGLLFLLDRFDDRPVSFTELQEHFDELVLGQIPHDLSRARDRKLLPLTANDTRYAYAEAHRNLRSSLIFMAIEGARPRTIVITSAIPGEGKSTVAVNLAITMAFAGSRVLLVDADLRKGTVHEYFELPNEAGLADVLAGEVPWDGAVQPTHVPNLHVLTRGNFPMNPGELILAGADGLLRDVQQHFDFVLFDSAPVLAADDTASLAPKVDGTLFVIRAAYTSARLARNALDILYQRQVNVMGLVFNSVESRSREYYYFKYPEYYSKRVAQR